MYAIRSYYAIHDATCQLVPIELVNKRFKRYVKHQRHVTRLLLNLADDDVVWMPSPIGHSTGLNFGVRLALYFGLPLVLQEGWDAERAAELVERERRNNFV